MRLGSVSADRLAAGLAVFGTLGIPFIYTMVDKGDHHPQAGRDELAMWDAPLLEAGSAVVEERLRTLVDAAPALGAAHAEIAPEEAEGGALTLRYVTNAPALNGESA